MLFDLHCDTLFELDKNGNNLDCSNLAVSLSAMEKFNRFIRCFAIFTPDELKGTDAQNHFNRLYTLFKKQHQLFKDRITHIIDLKTLQNACVGAVLTVENGSVLAGELSEIKRLANLGVNMITLTWNGENELGFGQLENRGLKPFGKQCVAVMEQNGIIVDVSHLSDRGFEDVCSISKKPFVASHSNARRVCGHKRNLADEQILEIISRGGIIGLNFYRAFLNDRPALADKFDLLRHAEHILELGGENALCIGTDFDGADVLPPFQNDTGLLSLGSFFCENGFPSETVNNILFKNAYHFFETYLKEEEVQK